jgi:hypothetical protein
VQGGLTRRRRFARALGRTERGAVTVEAALITPLILLIVFGAVEFGFFFKESHTVSSSATRGAREASALPKQPDYQLRVAKVLNNALSVLNADELKDTKVVIYRADTYSTLPGVDGTLPKGITQLSKVNDCTIQCWHFYWDPVTKTLKTSETELSASAWKAADMWACAPDPSIPAQAGGILDTVGVWISAPYKAITPLFTWLNQDVITRAVFVLEPVQPTATMPCTGTGTPPPAA